MFDGAVALDESDFGNVRKSKRGRGAAGKTAVFGILKRNGKVYIIIVTFNTPQPSNQTFIQEEKRYSC